MLAWSWTIEGQTPKLVLMLVREVVVIKMTVMSVLAWTSRLAAAMIAAAAAATVLNRMEAEGRVGLGPSLGRHHDHHLGPPGTNFAAATASC